VLRSVRGIHTTRAIARFLDVIRARSLPDGSGAAVRTDDVGALGNQPGN